ncbi:hypothetical protein SADUNF_Sadunf06G0085000 [Salix dunnii]|uniref:Protein kinase domain-containing protein n=1 Tax=Salix dunnii TaxID=1413687 RepID=A0A835K865_9ROSI|nr:hypothetical protein SADUNF_Sadunf06G0085000 [Salix dunnii]
MIVKIKVIDKEKVLKVGTMDQLKEDVARKYFQQLVSAVASVTVVFHRDLKPEILLLDEKENLKVSDFGLSALAESRRQVQLLHTTCGTPASVAAEVITERL